MTIDNRTRWLALLVLCLGDLMIVLDVTIVGVALPSIREDLGFTETSLAWVVNAYLLTFGGFLLLGGRLGDLFGHRRLFLIGTTLFTLASLACGLANSQELLMGARAVQGLGAAVVSAVALSLMMTLFTEPADRAKAMGIFGFVASGGGSIGVLLGGILTDSLSWHWIFLVNVPVGVLVVALTLKLVPASRGLAAERRLDVAGAITVTVALMLAVYAIVNGNQEGWTSLQTLGLLGAAARCWPSSSPSRRRAARRSCRSASSGCATSSSRTSSASSGRQRCSPGSSSPPSTSSSCSGTARCRSAWPSCPQPDHGRALGRPLREARDALRLQAAARRRAAPGRLGLLLFARAPVDGNYLVDVLPGMILLGLGAGIAFNPVLLAAMSDVKPSEAGLASGVVNTSFMMGGALGLAVLASLAASRTDTLQAAGDSSIVALTGGYHLRLPRRRRVRRDGGCAGRRAASLRSSGLAPEGEEAVDDEEVAEAEAA